MSTVDPSLKAWNAWLIVSDPTLRPKQVATYGTDWFRVADSYLQAVASETARMERLLLQIGRDPKRFQSAIASLRAVSDPTKLTLNWSETLKLVTPVHVELLGVLGEDLHLRTLQSEPPVPNETIDSIQKAARDLREAAARPDVPPDLRDTLERFALVLDAAVRTYSVQGVLAFIECDLLVRSQFIIRVVATEAPIPPQVEATIVAVAKVFDSIRAVLPSWLRFEKRVRPLIAALHPAGAIASAAIGVLAPEEQAPGEVDGGTSDESS
jgi:hypothetical protein